MSPKTRLCLVRHGETDWNTERRIQGQIDIPLNAKGRTQAVAMARGLADEHFAAVYCSDLARARQTAAALSGQAPIADPALRERHYGVLQSLTLEEARQRQPEAHRRYLARELDYDYDGGESLNGFAARAQAGIGALLRRHAGQTILAVSHGGVLDVVYRRASGRGLTTPRDFPVPNAAVNWLETEGEDWRILVWADQRHLGALDELPG
ncbi:MAG TPA: histidine phosphatase family protein [Rhodocyclaceae bacterium]|nr:histidine phosphatase family protein [Rhodocyclaceae bacterium]